MVDIAELRKSEFWRKKFRRAVETRDVDKNGFISRSDFELVLEHYKKTADTKEKYEALSQIMFSFCDNIGLVDDSLQLSYEEVEDRWQAMVAKGDYKDLFKRIFTYFDANGDGHISLSEWTIHNAALRISPQHAKNSFEAMDTDGDGKVIMDEFVEYHAEFFLTTENKLNSAILYGPL